MSRHTKDRKRKQKEKLEAEIRQENTVFDVLNLIRTENTDTKPNMGKFLKQYVKSIRATTDRAVEFYPEFNYRIQRVFVTFLDGHELLFYLTRSDKEQRYIYTYNYDDIELKPHDLDAIKVFFNRLFEFKFIHDTFDDFSQTANSSESSIISV